MLGFRSDILFSFAGGIRLVAGATAKLVDLQAEFTNFLLQALPDHPDRGRGSRNIALVFAKCLGQVLTFETLDRLALCIGKGQLQIGRGLKGLVALGCELQILYSDLRARREN